MPNAIYDDEDSKLRQDDAANPARTHYDRLTNLADAENGIKKDAQDSDAEAAERSLFNPGGDLGSSSGSSSPTKADQTSRSGRRSGGRLSRLRNRFNGMSTRRKIAVGLTTLAAVGTIGGGFFALFSFMNVFRVDHFLSNIERKAFIRYQVDMDGRSSKWIDAYIHIRLGEVDDPNLAPANRDNIIFRANRVDNNNPITDWYKTMRASKFEAELAEKHGIKFASIAVQEGNKVRIRPAVVTIGDTPIRHRDLSNGELRAIEDFDINGLNGRLRNFVQVDELSSDKVARKQIKKAVNDNTRWYQVMKRFYVRKSIQNMTGVRSWRFFEGTRNKAAEKRIEIRNKIIDKSLPEGTRSGKVARCLFGLDDCQRANRDTNNPETRAITNTSAPGSSDSTSSEDGSDESSHTTKSMVKNLLAKLNIATSIVSLLDTINLINNNIASKSLSNMVYASKAAQAIGLFTTFSIARDQMRSGENISAEEMNEVAGIVDGARTSEAWQATIQNSTAGSGRASAATIRPTDSREVYCSSKHQKEIAKPENRDIAESEIAYYCPDQKIGGDNAAKDVEDTWNKYIGGPLGPLLKFYNDSLLADLVGGINWLADHTVGPIVTQILKTLGVADNIEDLMAWAMEKVAVMLGATSVVDSNSPSGKFANITTAGASASAETAARFQGAPLTTDQSKARVEDAVAAFNLEDKKSQNVFERYASLSNTDSLVSKTLFAASNTNAKHLVSSAISSLGNTMFNPFGGRAAAVKETGYEIANMAGVDTYDFPAECINQDPLKMTPASSTNADEMGLIDAGDLTWELMENSDAFYGKLYADHPDAGDKIMEVYDCASFDSTIRGAVGGVYGVDPGPNALVSTEAGEDGVVGGSKFTIATFNIFHIDDKESEESWKNRLKLSVNTLLGDNPSDPKVDIAGLQEVRPDQLGALKTTEFGASTYDIYPKAEKNPEFTPNPIVWNKARFSFVKATSFKFQYFGGNWDKAPVILFEDNETGQQFYVANTHDPSDARGEASKLRLDNATGYVEQLKELQKEGLPIFFTGDFNSSYNLSGGNKPFNGERENLTYCVLTRSGTMWDAYDAANNKNGECPTSNGASGPDHIFMSVDVQASRYYIAKKGKTNNGSDVHNTVIADVIIPGEAQGDLGDSLNIATYNTLTGHFSGSERPGWDADDDQRYKKIADFIQAKDFHIMGGQEVRKDERAALVSYLPGFRATELGPDGSDVVFYRSDLFKQERVGYYKIPKAKGSPTAMWVKLTAKSTGKSLYIFNIHAMVGTSSDAIEQKKEDAEKTMEVYNAIVKDSEDPVFVMGDMNSNYTGPVAQVFRSSGKLALTFEATENRKGEKCDTHQDRDGKQDCRSGLGSHIDHIWFSKGSGIKVNSWENIADDTTIKLSDHNPVVVNVSIPGITGDNSGGDWVWPFEKNVWRGPLSSNAWGDRYCGSSCGRHSGIDIGGTGGKAAYAAHDGTVTKISTSGECKTSVLIKATGTSVWYGYQHLGSANVKTGDQVIAGKTVIGTVFNGSSGDCIQGAHLHFSIEKRPTISAYSSTSGVTCDISNVDCAKQMTTLPPLCLLSKDGRDLGAGVNSNQLKGSDYCNKLTAGISR